MRYHNCWPSSCTSRLVTMLCCHVDISYCDRYKFPALVWTTWFNDQLSCRWVSYLLSIGGRPSCIVICIEAVCVIAFIHISTLQWRQKERDGVSNHQTHECLLSGLFRHRSMKTSQIRVTGLCEWNSPLTGEFPAQRASYAENVSTLWRHREETNILPDDTRINESNMNSYRIW